MKHPELSAEDKKNVAAFWQLRSDSERRAADVFDLVGGDLSALGAAPALIDAARRSVDQERTHAELCRDVALSYDRDVVAKELETWPAADVHDGHDRTWRWRHIVGFCCVSETFASAFLHACWSSATAALPRTALHRLLADEVTHGQLGWAFMASPVAPDPGEVGRWLVPLLASYDDYLVKRATAYPSFASPAHGCPHPSSLVPSYRAAVEELILPGFERFGVSTVSARRWLDEVRRAPSMRSSVLTSSVISPPPIIE